MQNQYTTAQDFSIGSTQVSIYSPLAVRVELTNRVERALISYVQVNSLYGRQQSRNPTVGHHPKTIDLFISFDICLYGD